MPRTYVALDLELTGLDRQRDEIIEIALVRSLAWYTPSGRFRRASSNWWAYRARI
jgi:hypothetical protein